MEWTICYLFILLVKSRWFFPTIKSSWFSKWFMVMKFTMHLQMCRFLLPLIENCTGFSRLKCLTWKNGTIPCKSLVTISWVLLKIHTFRSIFIRKQNIGRLTFTFSVQNTSKSKLVSVCYFFLVQIWILYTLEWSTFELLSYIDESYVSLYLFTVMTPLHIQYTVRLWTQRSDLNLVQSVEVFFFSKSQNKNQ